MRRTLVVTSALLSCSAVFASPFGCDSEDPKVRLACFDQLAQAVSQCQAQQDQLDRLLCFDQ